MERVCFDACSRYVRYAFIKIGHKKEFKSVVFQLCSGLFFFFYCFIRKSKTNTSFEQFELLMIMYQRNNTVENKWYADADDTANTFLELARRIMKKPLRLTSKQSDRTSELRPERRRYKDYRRRHDAVGGGGDFWNIRQHLLFSTNLVCSSADA